MNIKTTKKALTFSTPAICLIILETVINVVSFRAQNYFPIRYPIQESLDDTIFNNVFAVFIFVFIPLSFLLFAINKYGTIIIKKASQFVFLFSLAASIVSIIQKNTNNGEFLRTSVGFIHIPSLLCFGLVFVTACFGLKCYERSNDSPILLQSVLYFNSIIICFITLSRFYGLIVLISFITSLFVLKIERIISNRQIIKIAISLFIVSGSLLLSLYIIKKVYPDLGSLKVINNIIYEKRAGSGYAPDPTILKEALKSIRIIGPSKFHIGDIPSAIYYAFLGSEIEAIMFGGGYSALIIVILLELIIVLSLYLISNNNQDIYSKVFCNVVAAIFAARTLLGVITAFIPNTALYSSCPSCPFLGSYSSVLFDCVLFISSVKLCTPCANEKSSKTFSHYFKTGDSLKTKIRNWIEADD